MNDLKPFLKWAGGKRRIARHILDSVGDFSGTYFEPFVGAGAVFFESGKVVAKHINDSNTELINSYIAVRDNVDEVLKHLAAFEATRDFYLEIRSLDREPNFDLLPSAFRAARFIYLNKTGFNGLHRVNSKGQFNVPFGKSAGNFIDEKNLKAVSAFLNLERDGSMLTKITVGDFVEATSSAKPGDFVYLDPPYEPLSSSSSFVAYSQAGFSRDDQLRVRDLFFEMVQRGVSIIASNSDTEFIRSIYNSKGTVIRNVSMPRAINSIGNARGHVPEVLIINLAA